VEDLLHIVTKRVVQSKVVVKQLSVRYPTVRSVTRFRFLDTVKKKNKKIIIITN